MLKLTVLNNANSVNIMTRRFIRNAGFKDIGIKHRAKLIAEEGNFENIDFDELETDFHGVEKSHKQHLRELEARKEQTKYFIVKQKYFKEKYPNFLTWADKQQIKHLNSTDPEEWSPDKLSEGFPALPETITKIIKNNWLPKNSNRVKHHDDAVQQNWTEFKKGHCSDIPDDLKNHLKKFTARELNHKNDFKVVTQADILKKKLVREGGEFSQIILSYQKLKETNGQKTIQEPSSSKLTITDTGINKHFATEFDKYKKSKNKLFTHAELEVTDSAKQLAIPSNEEESNMNEISLKAEDFKFQVAKVKSSNMNLYQPEKNYSNLLYPERIIIPKGKLKRGCTYKLNDCYYDDDGEFLYRVPGLG